MNGATAEPWVRTINPPRMARVNTIGNNQNFFLAFMKAQNSVTVSNMVEIIALVQNSGYSRR